MFEKFTSDAREAVVAAQKHARDLNSSRIETPHVLLGIIETAEPGLKAALNDEGYSADTVRAAIADGVCFGDRDAHALGSIGIDLDSVRASLEATFGEGALDRSEPKKLGWFQRRTGHIAFAPASKKALELSLREAIARKDNDIRCEHLLLGLVRGADDRFTAIVREPARLRARIETLVAEDNRTL